MQDQMLSCKPYSVVYHRNAGIIIAFASNIKKEAAGSTRV